MPCSGNLLVNADFNETGDAGVPAGWELSVGNPATAPALAVGGASAAFEMRENGASMGRLSQEIALPESVGAVRVRVRIACSGDVVPDSNSLVRVYWLDEPGGHEGWPPWVYRHFLENTPIDEKTACVDEVLVVPQYATRLRLDLIARWAPGGAVAFSEVRVDPAPMPEKRLVTFAVVQGFAPPGSTLDQACAWARASVAEAAAKGADLVCLGEAINFAGTGRKSLDCVEPVPTGPMCRALSQAARDGEMYVVAGVYEREGDICYNTAVLFGRDGQLVGKYRKVHLPATEVDDGFTPGGEFPVFQTDIGAIGMQVCYDNHFMEGSRILALNGAEIVCLPIWGEGRSDGTAWPLSVRARAMDNGLVYLAANYTEACSVIVDRNGIVLANAEGKRGVYTATVDLTPGYAQTRRTEDGRMPERSFKDAFRRERRPQTYGAFGEW